MKEKLQEIFESTQENGLKYDGSIKNIDFYAMLCKAASKDSLFSVKNMDDKTNVCMFSCSYENKDSILMIFYIPIATSGGVKHIAEKIMNLVKNLEDTFIVLDYVETKEIKDEKFVYMTVVKIL